MKNGPGWIEGAQAGAGLIDHVGRSASGVGRECVLELAFTPDALLPGAEIERGAERHSPGERAVRPSAWNRTRKDLQ